METLKKDMEKRNTAGEGIVKQASAALLNIIAIF